MLIIVIVYYYYYYYYTYCYYYYYRALGAPAANLSVSSVQNITTFGKFVAPVKQVQIITSQVDPQPSIMRFHTRCDHGATLSGTFVVTYHIYGDMYGPTRSIPADADEDMIAAMFEYDLALLGKINVTKTRYLGCNCTNSFEWTLTFLDFVRGRFGDLRFNTTFLNGYHAAIDGPFRIQEPALLRGGFRLIIDKKQSIFIPYDATEEQMTHGLNSIDMRVSSMQISVSDNSLARSWEVTFDVFRDFNGIPLLQTNCSELKGGANAVVWTEILREGIHSTNGLAGNFQLEFRGNITNRLPYNATAWEVKTALEALPSIGQVNVNRSAPSFILGYSWIIEILQANVATVQGYSPDTVGYIEPLIAHNELIGSDTSISVEILRQSTFGQSAGVVYIFQRQINSYVEVADIRGSDTYALNQFGFSVALDDDFLVVGAIAAGIQLNTTELGSAYIFRVYYTCFKNETVCPKTNWRQEAQFSPISGELEGYGNSVAISLPYVAVSAPFYNSNVGRVYIYIYDPVYRSVNGSYTGSDWRFLQTLQANDLHPGDYFGLSVALYQETLIVGAPYSNSGDGRVIVFKRTNVDGTFAESQNIYPITIGSHYGFSLAVQENVLVVGSPLEDTSAIYLGSTPSPSSTNVGQVRVYRRSKFLENYVFDHFLIPSNIKTNDRFGYDVAIDGNVIVVGAIESYEGTLLPDKAIVSVSTTADYGKETLSGYFKLYVNFTNSTDSFRSKSTRNIPADVTAAEMAIILQEDLNTGKVLVSRSGIDAYNKAYTWLVTFVGQTEAVSLPTPDWSGLFGTNASVNVSFVSPSPPSLRGKAHVFQKFHDTNNKYVEQFFLLPLVYQPSDRCGWQVRVSGSYALVACPNRDSVSVPNHNAGAGIIYDLSLLHVEFSSYNYEVPEGDIFNITVHRADSGLLTSDVLFFVSTVDRNANVELQTFFKNLYGLTASNLPFPLTYIDYSGIAGKAFARTQYYGSTHNESRWIDGMYDYRGIADYVPFNVAFEYLVEDVLISQLVVTNPDSILEVPDESVTLGIHAPGIWPSVLGRLYAYLAIKDIGNGLVSYGANYTASGNVQQYDEVYETLDDNNVGTSVAIGDLYDLLVSGSPLSKANDISKAGIIYCYRKVSEKWTEYGRLKSPKLTLLGRFGEEVVMKDYPKRNESILVVGEPGAGAVHIYTNAGPQNNYSWSFSKTLFMPTEKLPQSNYGSKGTIAMYGNILIVGSPAVETTYVYKHIYNATDGQLHWLLWQSLKSSDYDYDMVFGVPAIHRQGFGSAVAISERSIVIGSPHADYDKLGTDAVYLNWNTEGTDIIGYGRGKAYVFYSVPTTHKITIVSPVLLTFGTFKLQYQYMGLNQTTEALRYDSSIQAVKATLESLLNVDSVAVTFSNTFTVSRYTYQWIITFSSTWQDDDLLIPIWYNHSCQECIPFTSVKGESAIIYSNRSIDMTTFSQQQTLSAKDKRSGDRFGGSVAIDGNQIMVGAVQSSSIVTTTWDFEVGTLEGWSKTGTAFDYQPTFADNSRYRDVYPDITRFGLRPKDKPSRMDGRYYIGTYEARPGNPAFYGDGMPNEFQGGVQGDGPIGTLSSEIFIIYGSTISFLIGGGCDYYKEYVELMIDGMSVDKVTAKCSERMDRVFFDVSAYYGRAGQIRIVDNSKANWGHINVDDFKFDWSVTGARHNNTNEKVSVNGNVETPLSGSVYAYVRLKNDSVNLCLTEIEYCIWIQEAKLIPSDKRGNIRFGSTILLNDTTGVAFIAAPLAPCLGFYKESPSVYPYIDANGTSNAAGLQYPVSMYNMRLFDSFTLFAPQASGAGGVLKLLNESNDIPDPRFSSKCGAVYVYCKEKVVLSAGGVVLQPQHWPNVESMRLQPSDGYANDLFSSSMAMSSFTIALGAPGQDQNSPDGGALHTYLTAFSSISFAAVILCDEYYYDYFLYSYTW